MSFKRSEKHDTRNIPIAHQSEPTGYLREKYRSVLEGKEPESHPAAPSADTLVWMGKPRPEGSTSGAWLPGVDIRKVDMKAYNGLVGEGGEGKVGEWRQLAFYRILVDEEDRREDPDNELQLHISAHLYASDRNSLFMIQRAYGYQRRETRMGSLGHTVVFHGGVERLRMADFKGGRPESKWFVQEAWTSNSGENRGCHESRLWDWDKGEVVATTLQDGMVRVSAERADDAGPVDKGRRRAQRVEMEGEDDGLVKGKL